MKPVNGFTRKLHIYQIGSYIFFILLICSYFFLTFPLSKNVFKIVGGSLETFFAIIVFVSGCICTATDPSDTFLIETLKAKKENKEYDAPIKEFFCNADLAFVNESSKHCKRCDRCTEDFDHHCKWINNDVGKKNYKSFFILIVSVMCFLIIYLAMAIILTVNFANDNTLMNNDIFLYQNKSHQIRAVMIALWVVLALSIGFLLLDINLVLFHIFLIKKGLTTFQYIVLTEERKEYRREMDRARRIMGERKPKRTCLDFVLCLNRKKKKARDAKKTVAVGDAANEGPRNELSRLEHEQPRGTSPITLELAEIAKNKRDIGTYEIKVHTHSANNIIDETEKNKHNLEGSYKDNDGTITVNRALQKNYNSVAGEETKEETKRDLLGGTKEMIIPRKDNSEVEADLKRSPYVSEMNEFGDATAMNNSKNRSILNKSLNFESLKVLEERRSYEGHNVALQVGDQTAIQDLKRKNPRSLYHPKDMSTPTESPIIEIENKDLQKLKNQTPTDTHDEKERYASHEKTKDEKEN